MSFGPNGREHYNLYYIFAEDKEKHRLSEAAAELLWKKIQTEVAKSKGK